MRLIACHTPRLFWPALFACLLLPTEATPQIIISNDAEISDAMATQPLIGYRKASKEFFAAVNHKKADAAGIPVMLFVQSASATKTVGNAVSDAGKDPKSATLDDWYAATKTVGPNNKEQPERLITLNV